MELQRNTLYVSVLGAAVITGKKHRQIVYHLFDMGKGLTAIHKPNGAPVKYRGVKEAWKPIENPGWRVTEELTLFHELKCPFMDWRDEL